MIEGLGLVLHSVELEEVKIEGGFLISRDACRDILN